MQSIKKFTFTNIAIYSTYGTILKACYNQKGLCYSHLQTNSFDNDEQYLQSKLCQVIVILTENKM